MNERIKLLAEQAERLAEDELAHLERVHNRLYSFTEGREIYNEKFALLIVRECADILEPNGAYAKKYKHAHVPGPDGLRTPLSIREFINMQSAQKLREHFGVEE